MSNVESRKYRRGTSTYLKFPTLPSLTAQPRRIDIYEKQYSHDVMVLEYSSESPLWFEYLKTGVPVQFTWQQDTLDKNWIGYVVSTTKNHAPQRTNIMQVMCVGGTFPLKDRVTRVFQNSTIPEAVAKIASEYGFSTIIDAHPQRFPQLAIAGVSYWEWMQEQAKRIGYGLIVDGMTLVFRPLDKVIDMGFSNAPVLSLGNASAPFNSQFLDRTLDEFKIIYGDNVEESNNLRTVKNVAGIDPITGQLVSSTADPSKIGDSLRETVGDALFSEFRTDRVVNDITAAEEAAKGAAQMARFNIPANVKCQGDPRIRPFGTVYISGTGNLSDGFWIVREARHMFHKIGDYQMELKVATDGVGDTVVETPFRTRPADAPTTVNSNEVEQYGSDALLDFSLESVFLYPSSTQIESEAGQGFKKSGQRWYYNRKVTADV